MFFEISRPLWLPKAVLDIRFHCFSCSRFYITITEMNYYNVFELHKNCNILFLGYSTLQGHECRNYKMFRPQRDWLTRFFLERKRFANCKFTFQCRIIGKATIWSVNAWLTGKKKCLQNETLIVVTKTIIRLVVFNISLAIKNNLHYTL